MESDLFKKTYFCEDYMNIETNNDALDYLETSSMGSIDLYDEDYGNSAIYGSENIRVAARFRPSKHVKDTNSPWYIHTPTSTIVDVSGTNQNSKRNMYAFDGVYDGHQSTRTIYEDIAQNIVDSAISGVHGTILTYGHTASGKTYTMQGTKHQEGVLQYAVKDVFEKFTHVSENSAITFVVTVSYIEIYNEKLHDLLATTEDEKQGKSNNFTRKWIQRTVKNVEEALQVFKEGERKRTIGTTLMNDRSSRSHTLFRLSFTSSASTDEYSGEVVHRTGCLNFVDLAGSEGSRHTGTIGKALTEGGNINRSLLALSKVVRALSMRGGENYGRKSLNSGKKQQPQHINFRDSKLTRILQPSLCGKGRVLFICCVSPEMSFIDDTRRTLRFATRAKMIKINASMNEEVANSLERQSKRRAVSTNHPTEFSSTTAMAQVNAELSFAMKRLQLENKNLKLEIQRLKSAAITAGILHDNNLREHNSQKIMETTVTAGAAKRIISVEEIDSQATTEYGDDDEFRNSVERTYGSFDLDMDKISTCGSSAISTPTSNINERNLACDTSRNMDGYFQTENTVYRQYSNSDNSCPNGGRNLKSCEKNKETSVQTVRSKCLDCVNKDEQLNILRHKVFNYKMRAEALESELKDINSANAQKSVKCLRNSKSLLPMLGEDLYRSSIAALPLPGDVDVEMLDFLDEHYCDQIHLQQTPSDEGLSLLPISSKPSPIIPSNPSTTSAILESDQEKFSLEGISSKVVAMGLLVASAYCFGRDIKSFCR